MTYDYLLFDNDSKTPLYQQLYTNIRTAAESGRLKRGEKLPSIRKLSQDLNLSRTTVETAYQQLCVEGYVKSRPQSGYFVAASGGKHLSSLPAAESSHLNPSTAAVRVRFNFGTDFVDRKNSDIKIWRRHIRDILNRQEIITSYGNPQGEPNLREALSSYSYGVRGVAASPDQIVIGAGTQPLLYILCGLLEEKRIAMEEQGFLQAERVFADCGVESVPLPADDDGLSVEALKSSGVHAVLISPSRSVRSGTAIPMSRRYALLEWAQKGGFLIEDDYNGELRYNARPIPAVQGIADRENVVYLGSFSKLLLPSVRIGYMVLPSVLLQKYKSRSKSYNQTASKIEQLALSGYIKSGQMERQLRRLRKLYAAKSDLLEKELQRAFGNHISLVLQETSLTVLLTPKNGISPDALCHLAGKNGVRIFPSKDRHSVTLGFAGIPLEDIPAAVSALEEVWVPLK